MCCSATSPGAGEHPPGGDTQTKKMWANLQRTVDKRVRTGKKGVGDTLQGGDTRVKSIKVTVMREKVIFSEKKQ